MASSSSSLAGWPRYETQLGLLAALEPPRLGMAVVRVAVIEVALVATAKKETADDSSVEAVAKRIALGVAKSMSVTTTKAVLQRVSAESLDNDVAAALMTDVSNYAVRHDATGQDRAELALEIVPVAAQAIVLQHVAFFLVYEAFDIGTYLLRRPKGDRLSQERQLARLRQSTLKNVGVCVGSIGLGSLGYALGTLVRPGFGTGLVGTIFETVLYLL